ncbi:MAG: hypothetical protein KDE14_13310 [Rhodobacteraceae bacterium]|nr:hypothetical protein [Paracoccaceae bacterium]
MVLGNQMDLGANALLIDRLIALINPKWAKRRVIARARLREMSNRSDEAPRPVFIEPMHMRLPHRQRVTWVSRSKREWWRA